MMKKIHVVIVIVIAFAVSLPIVAQKNARKNEQGTVGPNPLELRFFTENNALGDGVPKMTFEQWKGHGLYTLGGMITLTSGASNTSTEVVGDVFTVHKKPVHQTIKIGPKTRVTVVDYDINTGTIMVQVNENEIGCYLFFAPSQYDGKFYLVGQQANDGGLDLLYDNGKVFHADAPSIVVHLGFYSTQDEESENKERIELGTEANSTTSSGTSTNSSNTSSSQNSGTGSMIQHGNFQGTNSGNKANNSNGSTNTGNKSSQGTGGLVIDLGPD